MVKQTTKKKTNKKGYSESTMHRLWRKSVLKAYDHRCFFCGIEGDKNLQCHHFVPRKVKVTRWKWQNGIAVCPKCHEIAHSKTGIYLLLLNYKYYFEMARLEKEEYTAWRKKNKISHVKYYKQLHDEMISIIKGVKKMQFYKYKNGADNTRKCGYEIFEKSKKKTCDKPAVGEIREDKLSVSLCQEHFEYALDLYSVKEIKEI